MEIYSEAWRKISDTLPPLIRNTIIVSFVFGEGLHDIVGILEIDNDWHINLDAPGYWGWTLIAMVVLFPFVAIWAVVIRPWLGLNSAYDRAEEYIRIMKMAMREAQMTKAEQKYQWRAAMQKLADDFKVYAQPPPVNALGLPDAKDKN